MDRDAALLGDLRSLVAALVEGPNPFYAPRLRGLELGSVADFVAKVSFTTKEDLALDREAHPPFGTNLSAPLSHFTRFHQTSGTGGSPMAWLDTPSSWSGLLDCWDVIYEACGAGSGSRVFFAFSFGPFLGFWAAFEAATRRGNLAISGGGMGTAARLKAIDEYGVDILCCTPTYAIRLGEAAAEQGISGLPVRTIIVAGEPGGSIPETRARIGSLWPGARVWDHHGMTEVGPVSFEHPECPGTLCVIESAYFAEILDPETGREVGEGDVGELVLTTLRRAACPLLRYRTGDLVRKKYVDYKRSRTLALEGGILGRADDMIVVRGVNVYPSAVESVIRRFEEVAEFQVVLGTARGMAEISVRIEPHAPGNGNALREAVAGTLAERFALRIPVSVVDAGTLPRFEFKAKRWVREEDDARTHCR
jgi:phenylacetate-CoA ligase